MDFVLNRLKGTEFNSWAYNGSFLSVSGSVKSVFPFWGKISFIFRFSGSFRISDVLQPRSIVKGFFTEVSRCGCVCVFVCVCVCMCVMVFSVSERVVCVCACVCVSVCVCASVYVVYLCVFCMLVCWYLVSSVCVCLSFVFGSSFA
jgi:hypothetical protein